MMVFVANVYRLYSISSSVWPGDGLRTLVRRVAFLWRALVAYDSVKPFLDASPGSNLGILMARRPQILGAIIWPYQCVEWSVRARLARIHEHCSIVEKIGPPIDFHVGEELELLTLNEIYEGLRVVVEQPEWFMREGQLVISLFVRGERVYSLAFSLTCQAGKIAAFIGAVQGRDLDGMLDLYRELTKTFYGMRPRDLLIELFGMLCDRIGVSQILAVSDDNRHHRSSYFGTTPKSFSVNYDDIWIDRGGTRINSTSYLLKLNRQRDYGAIPSKKRAMYKKRYELLDVLRQKMCDSYHRARL